MTEIGQIGLLITPVSTIGFQGVAHEHSIGTQNFVRIFSFSYMTRILKKSSFVEFKLCFIRTGVKYLVSPSTL